MDTAIFTLNEIDEIIFDDIFDITDKDFKFMFLSRVRFKYFLIRLLEKDTFKVDLISIKYYLEKPAGSAVNTK